MIDIAIITWPQNELRMRYFSQTILNLRRYVRDRPQHLRYLVSAESEGAPIGHRQEFESLCREYRVSLSWHDPPASIGGNFNAVLAKCESSHVLLMQDDWLLVHPVRLSEMADFLDESPGFAMVRLSWSPRPQHTWRAAGLSSLWGTSCGPLWEIDRSSPYFYGDQPHVRRRDGLPLYVEGGNMGTAEVAFNGHLKRDKCRIAMTHVDLFEHLGSQSTRRDPYEVTSPEIHR